MKIVRDLQYFETARFHFVHGKIKQRPVVRLELDRAVFSKDLREPAQVFLAGKPSLGVPVLWPGIREVQIYLFHFSFAKIFTDQLSISPYKQKVSDLRLIQLVQSPYQNT